MTGNIVDVKCFSSWEEVPDKLEPGDYIIREKYVRIYEEVDKETLIRA